MAPRTRCRSASAATLVLTVMVWGLAAWASLSWGVSSYISSAGGHEKIWQDKGVYKSTSPYLSMPLVSRSTHEQAEVGFYPMLIVNLGALSFVIAKSLVNKRQGSNDAVQGLQRAIRLDDGDTSHYERHASAPGRAVYIPVHVSTDPSVVVTSRTSRRGKQQHPASADDESTSPDDESSGSSSSSSSSSSIYEVDADPKKCHTTFREARLADLMKIAHAGNTAAAKDMIRRRVVDVDQQDDL